MNITENERRVLEAIAHNHYGDTPGDPIWSDSINDSERPSGIEGRKLSGVCASLEKKGLTVTGYIDAPVIALTEAGAALINA